MLKVVNWVICSKQILSFEGKCSNFKYWKLYKRLRKFAKLEGNTSVLEVNLEDKIPWNHHFFQPLWTCKPTYCIVLNLRQYSQNILFLSDWIQDSLRATRGLGAGWWWERSQGKLGKETGLHAFISWLRCWSWQYLEVSIFMLSQWRR